MSTERNLIACNIMALDGYYEGPWRDTTRIIGGDNVYDEIAKLKSKRGKDIVTIGSRML